MAGTASNAQRPPQPPDEEIARAYQRMADLLEAHLDEVSAEFTEACREALPGYAEVSYSSVYSNARRAFEVVLQQFRRGAAPDEEDAGRLASLVRRWASMELSLNSISRSFSIGGRRLVWLVSAHAETLELDADGLFAVQDTAWAWASLGPSVIADVQREEAVSAARRDAVGRADFLRDLSWGRMTAERLADEATIYGLDISLPYVAVCASCDGVGPCSVLESKIRRSGSTSTHRVMQAAFDGGLLAVAPQRPAAPDGVTVAVGPAMLLSQAHESFAEARQALATAEAFGMKGTVDLTDLGPLSLVTVGDHVASRLNSAYFSELDTSFGEIEHTVLTLLELDQSIEDTAAKLHLHRNTVRYRVNRFRDVTGLDLRQTRDLVTAWWLLEWRRAHPRD